MLYDSQLMLLLVSCSRVHFLANLITFLYPVRSRWGTYRGCCSRRDEARASVKTGNWAGRTHSQ